MDNSKNDDNPTIQVKRNPSGNRISSHVQSTNRLKQVQTILYRVNQQQYQIKVSHHLNSWDIPYRYYNSQMDPVKSFLNNNTIKNYINRFYWSGKQTLYMS